MPRNIRGERDATQAETISGFAEKPLGFYDTSHIVRGPDGLLQLVGLSARKVSKDAPLLPEIDVNKFRNQTPGWKLLKNEQGVAFLRQEWKVKDFTAAVQMFERIGLVAEEAGHHPDLHLRNCNEISAELSTHSLGGLTETDFIVAARMNAISVKDLMPKPKARFWA